MKLRYFNLVIPVVFLFTGSTAAQIDDICREHGAVPTLDAPKLQAPFLYGKIAVKGSPTSQPLKITVTYSDANQPAVRQLLNGGGNYCFKRTGGDGTLVIDVGGTEFVRKTVPAFGQPQQREDFEISAAKLDQTAVPTVVSAKFPYKRTQRNTDLFIKAAEAERNSDRTAAVGIIKEVVSADPADFIAWAKLGSLFFEQGQLPEAEAAFRKCLELKVEYTPSWIYMGRIRVAQTQFEIAIEIFKQAISTDANSARAYQLLGETYLQAKKGTLGVEALNTALKIDPVGMAECHLTIAKLYDLAGAKPQASKEYKAFLLKRPEYAEKARLEKYIKENS